MSSLEDLEYQRILQDSANTVHRQLAEDGSVAIAVDPDLAEFMGASLEDAVALEDLGDDDDDDDGPDHPEAA